ncbi:hypothetical protein D046_8202A, partial [Vibrio parahaemolyticus V-223/04]
MKMPRV